VGRPEVFLEKRTTTILSVVFAGGFIVLLGFLFFAWVVVKSLGASVDLESGPRVAIIEAKGVIGENENGVDGDNIVKLLRKYEKDDDIKAIVLRVDSPGGAVAPSQDIYDQVKKSKTKKKIVVSMSNLAASGGYYISAAADKIYAQPGTLTGSIGVIFMHFNVRGLLGLAHVEETTVMSGKYKDALSPFRPISDTDREEIQGISDDIYAQFVHAVAEGRGMTDDDVRKIAEGRIYTGRRAKELHLVDELGGLEDAIAAAWTMAGQKGEPKVQPMPRKNRFSLRAFCISRPLSSSDPWWRLKGSQLTAADAAFWWWGVSKAVRP
jgi:protease IV